jgi:hypothetical protein
MVTARTQKTSYVLAVTCLSVRYLAIHVPICNIFSNQLDKIENYFLTYQSEQCLKTKVRI